MRIDPDALGVERVLAVGAHPDDAEFYAGATLARLAAAGARVTILVMTDGQRGGQTPADLATLRAGEQRAALDALGIGEHHNLGQPDGELQPTQELLGRIVLAIRSLRPDVVLTHDPRTFFTVIGGIAQLGHSDHRATGELVMNAVMPRAILGSFFPEQLAQPEVTLWYPRELWLFDTAEPNAAVDVEPVRAARDASLRAHASQNDGDMLVHWATARGDETFVRLPLWGVP